MRSKYARALLPALSLAALLAAAPAFPAPADPALQARFEAAMEAVEQDRLRTARESLSALLEENPSLLRARLELARVHYQTGDYAAARAEAERVLAEPELPPEVRITVLAFLAQIDADAEQAGRRHLWTPSIYAGLMFDTNATFGPSREVIDIGGLPFTVVPEAREQEDGAVVLIPGILHTWNPGRRFQSGEHTGQFLWQSQANAYYRAYFDEDDFNLGVLTLRTGPAWVVPRRWRAHLGLQGDQIWLGDESLALYSTLNPAFTWVVGPDTELTLDGALTRRHYWDSDEDGRDGWYKAASLVADHRLGQSPFVLQAGAGYLHFDADDERFSHSGPELFAGLVWRAWERGALFGRVAWRQYDFDGPEPLFNVARDEDEIRTLLGFQHEFAAGALADWSLQGSWIYTNNDSNVALYDYDRHQFSLGLARSF